MFLGAAIGLAFAVEGMLTGEGGVAVYIAVLALFPLTLLSLRVLDRHRGTDTSLLRTMVYGLVMSTGGLGGLVLGVFALFDPDIVLGVILLASSPIVLFLGAANLVFGVHSLLAKRQRSRD